MSNQCHEPACQRLGQCTDTHYCGRSIAPMQAPYRHPPALDPEDVAEAALELAQALTQNELPIKQLVAGALALCRFELGFRPDDRESLIEQLGIDIREGRAVTPESLAEHTA